MTKEQRVSKELHKLAKTAAKKLIDECGGIDGAAASCRLSRSHLAACSNKADLDRYMPIDVMVALERTINNPAATRILADYQNHILILLPHVDADSGWQQHFNKTVKKTSRLFKHIVTALEDNTITPLEAEVLIEHANDALTAFSALKTALQKVVDKKPQKVQLLKAG